MGRVHEIDSGYYDPPDEETIPLDGYYDSPEDRDMNEQEKLFEDWWKQEGQCIDPDFSDVPWFDKRKGLAAEAFYAAMAMSRNYTADDATEPEQFVFANGRVVTIGDDDTLKIGTVDALPKRRAR